MSLYCILPSSLHEPLVSIWYSQLQASFRIGHAQTGENPELRAFFFRLAMLTERPVHLVFVEDGPNKPKKKRGKNVRTTPHWLNQGMREFAEAFGCSWLQARNFLGLYYFVF